MSHKIVRDVRVATGGLLKSRRRLRNASLECIAEPLEARRLLSVSAATLVGQALTVGATATYVTTFSSSSDTETDTCTVQAKTTAPGGQPATRVADHRVYRSRATTSTSDGTEWYGLNTDGYVEFFKRWDVSSSIYKNQFTPPMVLLPPTMSVGKSYRSTYEDEWYYITPGISTGTSNHTRTATLASETPRSVTVPAGTFKAYEVDVVDATIGGGSSTTRSYYAPGVGFIKSVSGDPSDSTTTVLTAATKIPKKLEFGLWPPSSGVSGVKLTPEIYVYVDDSDGNVVLSDISSVTLAVKSGPVGGELGGTVTVAAKNGAAKFNNVNLNIPGTYTLEATDESLTPAVSKSIKIISKASASKLAFTAQPSNTVAGKTITPVSVAVEYPGGGIVLNDTSTVTLALASGPGTLGGTLAAKAVNGIATFSNLVLTKAGTYTLRATDGKLTPATSNSFKITAAAATKLVFAAAPKTAVAGKAIAPAVVVNIDDRFGNIVTTNTSTVAMAIASGAGTLGGTKSIAAKAGVATFSNLVISKVGTYTIKATDGALTAATSATFKITPAAAAKLVVATQPALTTIAGKAISPTIVVDIDDAFGNIATSNTSTVTLSVASGGGTFTGTFAVAAKAGVATFSNVILTRAGAHTLKAADGSLTAATSRSFTITPAAASKLVLAKPVPATSTAGKAISPAVVIDVEDQFGNIVTANKSNVTMSILTGPTGATLTGTGTVAAKAGVATFSNLLLTRAGSYTIRAADGAMTAAKSAAFKVNPAAAKKLVFIQPPTPAKVSTALSPAITVAVEDSFGNIVTTDKSKVAIAIASGPNGALLGGTTTPAAVKGIATFANLQLSTAGTYKLKVTDGILTNAVSGPFVIT